MNHEDRWLLCDQTEFLDELINDTFIILAYNKYEPELFNAYDQKIFNDFIVKMEAKDEATLKKIRNDLKILIINNS